ncbi:MAG: tRNA (adenosine(37)-N6)-threonylcarbamoyltransferase complex dimerization subunit type 1 TsaB [Succinivibrionaceae bacterium]|nr:tRNA (adenosine(37)-N6)-threonylcarbamoyltransferase complex dimerization subunit type 1 TsaB [Succinivibrionaceae bacterium]
MNILAIDTATEACSAALRAGSEVFARSQVIPQGHTRVLLDMVDALLHEARLDRADLELIACGRGPGSFTGVRIGVGAAQGLALGLGLKLLGVSDLQILAQGAIRQLGAEKIAVAVDARMSEVYFALFENRDGLAVAVSQERVCAPALAFDEIQKTFGETGFAVTGTGFAASQDLKGLLERDGVPICGVRLPESSDMLPYVLAHPDEADLPENIVPLYLRNDVTWKKIGEQKKSGERNKLGGTAE